MGLPDCPSAYECVLLEKYMADVRMVRYSINNYTVKVSQTFQHSIHCKH